MDLVLAVRQSISRITGLPGAQVHEDGRLLADFALDSIDLIELLVELETSTGRRLSMSGFADYMRGELSQEEFADADGMVTPAAAKRLARVMPQLREQLASGPVNSDALLGWFTVANLAALLDS